MLIQQKKVVYLIYDVFLGLARPAVGPGCVAARRSARPFGGFAASVWPSATAIHP